MTYMEKQWPGVLNRLSKMLNAQAPQPVCFLMTTLGEIALPLKRSNCMSAYEKMTGLLICFIT